MDSENLLKTKLFKNLNDNEFQILARNLGFYKHKFKKGENILRTGETINSFGLVISGSVNIEYNDIFGNTNIIGNADSGQVFAEAYSCLPEEPLMVSVSAAEDCEILFISTKNIFSGIIGDYDVYSKFISNLIAVLAGKNIGLSRKINDITPKTIRERLISYLSSQAVKQESNSITIPFNRQQLADYLCVDRSGMSNELSKMRRDGLLTFDRNMFKLNLSAFMDK